MMLKASVKLLCLLVCLSFLPSCHFNRRERRREQRDVPAEWSTYRDQFLEAYFVARPDFAVRAGRHEFDGKLPDWSPEAITNEIKRLRKEKERVARFDDDDLDERENFEREYVDAIIDADLFWLESAEWPFRNPQYYADAIDPDVYVSRKYASLDVRMRAYTKYAQAIPKALDQIRANLRTPLPKTYVAIGGTTFGGLVNFY